MESSDLRLPGLLPGGAATFSQDRKEENGCGSTLPTNLQLDPNPSDKPLPSLSSLMDRDISSLLTHVATPEQDCKGSDASVRSSLPTSITTATVELEGENRDSQCVC